MSEEIITVTVELVIMVAAFLLGKFVFPKIPEGTLVKVKEGIELIVTYADKYVSWAKQFMATESGEDKMNAVVKELAKIAERYNIDITESEIKAIAQKAYDEMKKGEAEAANTVILEQGATTGIDTDTNTNKSTDKPLHWF